MALVILIQKLYEPAETHQSYTHLYTLTKTLIRTRLVTTVQKPVSETKYHASYTEVTFQFDGHNAQLLIVP